MNFATKTCLLTSMTLFFGFTTSAATPKSEWSCDSTYLKGRNTGLNAGQKMGALLFKLEGLDTTRGAGVPQPLTYENSDQSKIYYKVDKANADSQETYDALKIIADGINTLEEEFQVVPALKLDSRKNLSFSDNSVYAYKIRLTKASKYTQGTLQFADDCEGPDGCVEYKIELNCKITASK